MKMVQFNGTVEQLENSVALTQDVADYIVERKTIQSTAKDGQILNWLYTKWKSGYQKLECTYRWSNNAYIETAWGNMYYEQNPIVIAGEYPVAFSDAPTCNIAMINADPQTYHPIFVQQDYSDNYSGIDTTTSLPHFWLYSGNKELAIGHPTFKFSAEGQGA